MASCKPFATVRSARRWYRCHPASFLMGTAENQRLIDPRTGKPATNDGPQHRVALNAGFAIGRYEVTVAQFAEFVAATGYKTVDRCMEFSKPGSFSISKDVDWGNTGFQPGPRSARGVCVLLRRRSLCQLAGRAYRA